MKHLALICTLIVVPSNVSGLAADDATQSTELFQSLDKNQDGKLQADEIPQAQARYFERLVRIGDKNADGQLSKEEFVASLNAADRPVAAPEANQPGQGRGGEQLRTMLKQMDRNGDGKISRSEIPEQAPERMQTMLKGMFDRSGTDELSLEQMAARMQQFGPRGAIGDAPRPPILNALDVDGDRRISKDEFAKVAEKFGELDRNGDGFLDVVEILGVPPASDRAGMPADGATRRPGQPGARPVDGANIQELLTRLDQDGDGALSESEAPERMKERFSDLDKNSDGKLTRDELRGATLDSGRNRPRRRPE